MEFLLSKADGGGNVEFSAEVLQVTRGGAGWG